MQNDIDQRISQLIDDELNNTETLELLKKIKHDDTLRKRMFRYQAVSQSIKSGKFILIKSDFIESISHKIQQEPAYLLPPKKSSTSKLKTYATAASILAVAVFAGQVFLQNQSANENKNLSVAAITTQNNPSEPNRLKSASEKNKPLNAEFNAYLQAHNSSFYTNGEAYFQQDAKIVSFGGE
jgi:sigma-E factor negative regulatory protein RseA